MKEDDLKAKYRQLIQELKKQKRDSGERITNEVIAEALDYERSYFSTLLGKRGIVKEKHIKDLMLHFPTLKDDQPKVHNSKPVQDDDLKKLIDANHMLAQSILIDSKNRESLTESNRELTKKVTAGAQPQNEQAVVAMRSAFLELLGQVGSGKRFHSPDELKTAYNRLVSEAMVPKDEVGIQKHSSKQHI